MKTLEQFNEEKLKEYEGFGKPCKNGIKCPNCGAELWDCHPLTTLTSDPPQKQICCKSCDYKGFRIA